MSLTKRYVLTNELGWIASVFAEGYEVAHHPVEMPHHSESFVDAQGRWIANIACDRSQDAGSNSVHRLLPDSRSTNLYSGENLIGSIGRHCHKSERSVSSTRCYGRFYAGGELVAVIDAERFSVRVSGVLNLGRSLTIEENAEIRRENHLLAA